MLHRLVGGEHPLNVPLIFVCFEVQVHDLPLGFFPGQIAKQLRDFVRVFMDYDKKNLERGFNNYMRICVWIDV